MTNERAEFGHTGFNEDKFLKPRSIEMDYSNLLACNLTAKSHNFENEDDYYAMYGQSGKFEKLKSIVLRCVAWAGAIGRTIASARGESVNGHVEV